MMSVGVIVCIVWDLPKILFIIHMSINRLRKCLLSAELKIRCVVNTMIIRVKKFGCSKSFI
jgi:hypothetical protein